DRVTNRRLEEEKFERFGALEAEEIDVGESAEFRSDVEVGAGVGEEDAGVDEFGLAFVFAGAQIGNEAAGRSEKNAGTGETDAFAIPKAEQAAGKVREIEDGIEAASAGVARGGVTGSVEGRDAVAHPVAIVREFGGGELSIDGDGTAGDGIEGVFTDGLIEGVREIEAADGSAAAPAKVPDADAVGDRSGARILVNDIADGSGADKETVVVVVD